MNVALLTYSCAFNYGAALQTYGLCQHLNRLGHTVSVIDYIPECYQLDAPDYPEKAIRRTRLWKRVPFSIWLWKKLRLSQMLENRVVFRAFLESRVPLTRTFYGEEELRRSLPAADLYVTGSDQVWNPDFVWNGGIDGAYFLSFLPDSAARISYASSFGKSALTEREQALMFPYLRKYGALSVREESAVGILRRMGLDGASVADPTILAGRSCFEALADGGGVPKPPYMLLFQTSFHQPLYRLCGQAARLAGMPLVTLLPDAYQKEKCRDGNVISLPSVERWLGLFQNAAYVVSNSFHATVFSLMFERPFSVFAANYGGRITSLLEKTGLESRLLPETNLKTLRAQMESDILGAPVREALEAWRVASGAWLENAIRENVREKGS